MNEHLSLHGATLLTARRHGLRAGQDNVLDVLVRIQAPDAPDATEASNNGRPAQAVALVIDRSGSMAGQPLSEAQRCAEFVVSRLRPIDTVSVVEFDNRVARLWPAVPIGNGDAVRAAIGRIRAGGNTNLHGGWLEGAATLGDVGGAGLKRVILLSDGCANEGLTDSAQIAEQCAALAQHGITTSTYGLGNNFNEDLMVSMARAGGGNSYYGDGVQDLIEPFQQELDLLANLALQQVELSVQAPDGVQVQMLNDLAGSDSPGLPTWRLPDLAWGAEAWALLRLSIPATALPALAERLTVLRVSVRGRSLQGEVVGLETAGLALQVLSERDFDALPENELVQRRTGEVEAAQIMTRMRAAALDHDWPAVDGMLADAQARFASNEWLGAMLSAMSELAADRSRERMMKEARYASSKLSYRLVAKDEGPLGVGDVEIPAFLRRKTLQGKSEL